MIDSFWLLISSGLIFMMQPGFMCLEAGLIRAKNSTNIAIKNFVDFGISVLLFWAIGYGLMFGTTHQGWIGTNNFLMPLEVNPERASFFIFQVMFCSTAITIISGAVAERLRFPAYLLITCVTSGLIYPIFGHWAWNGFATPLHTGWLRHLGFVDFSGSTVVHSIGGWVALAALLVLGPRQGRFPPHSPAQIIPASNLPLSVLGTFLIWVGWLGFNGGNTLMFDDRVAGILGHTVMAGATGMIVALVLGWWLRGAPDVPMLINGSLGGLVGVTASCHVITTAQSVIIGAVAAAIVVACDRFLESLRIDDAVGAVAVHTGAGIWGTLAVALFGNLELMGLDMSRWQHLQVQLLGIATAFLWGFVLPYLLFRTINTWFPFRVSAAQEESGLNSSEHNIREEIQDLFQVMERQAQAQDLSLRVPVEPFTEVGRIAQRYNQVMDALQEAILRTEAIVNTAADAILTFRESDLQILSANPSASQIFGRSIPDLCSLTLRDLIADNSRLPTSMIESIAVANTGQSCNIYQEFQGQQVDGQGVPLEGSMAKATLGDRSFLTGIFRDISERKQAETQMQSLMAQLQHTSLALQNKNQDLETAMHRLQRTQAQLVQQEKMASLEKMVGGIAHEFNNPVNYIFGNLVHLQQYAHDLLNLLQSYQNHFPNPGPAIQQQMETIDLDFVQDDLPKILHSIQQGAIRIRDIVQSLRIFSRLDEASLKRVDLHSGLDSTLLLLQGRLRGSGGFPSIEVRKTYEPVPLVECYAKELNQVCLHILSNAIDALYEAMVINQAKGIDFHPAIDIKILAISDQERVSIQIHNNGPEIPQNIQSKLFDPFFTTKPVGQGVGLGLAESYKIIVDQHGGDLWCQSSPHGTTFSLSIPITQAAYLKS